MRIQGGNLFGSGVSGAGAEEFHPLINGSRFRLEAIHSHGHPSPPSFWYEQADEEWVLLARGKAVLELEGLDPVAMVSGDFLLLPAGCRHRVASVSEDAVWVALHFLS